MKLQYLLVAVFLLASGCATRLSVPPERLLAFRTATPETSATLIVTRDEKGTAGSACYFGFFINDVLAARMDSKETATFHVPTGKLILGSGRDPHGQWICDNLKDERAQREEVLRDGEKRYFRLTIADGKTDIQSGEPGAR